MKRYSPEEKAKHVKDWQTSGLSKKAYCLQHEIKYSTFKQWFKTAPLGWVEGGFIPAQVSDPEPRLAPQKQVVVLLVQDVSWVELAQVVTAWMR